MEELDIMEEDSPGCSDKILRWMIPGLNPLKLTFVGIPPAIAVPFCTHSNITWFHGEDFVIRVVGS
jgi:hypothetical protein